MAVSSSYCVVELQLQGNQLQLQLLRQNYHQLQLFTEEFCNYNYKLSLLEYMHTHFEPISANKVQITVHKLVPSLHKDQVARVFTRQMFSEGEVEVEDSGKWAELGQLLGERKSPTAIVGLNQRPLLYKSCSLEWVH